MVSDPGLARTLDNFREKRILIIGDVMVDEYLWGTVQRISPEAPVPVVSCNKREYRMGGAANVAVNIKALEAEPILCAIIGRDEGGSIFQQLIRDNGMLEEGIQVSAHRKTTLKTRVIGNHQHLLRVDDENTHPISQDEEVMLLDIIGSQIQTGSIDTLIFQDYDKGVITPKIISHVVEIAREKNIPVLVDPKKLHFSSYEGIDLFKPNIKEFTEGLHIKSGKADYSSIYEHARRFLSDKKIRQMLITLSEKGVFYCDEREFDVIPAEQRDVADVSGAGDTVIAVAALCKACGMPLKEIARLANLAGGLVCEKVGVVPITRELFLKGAK